MGREKQLPLDENSKYHWCPQEASPSTNTQACLVWRWVPTPLKLPVAEGSWGPRFPLWWAEWGGLKQLCLGVLLRPHKGWGQPPIPALKKSPWPRKGDSKGTLGDPALWGNDGISPQCLPSWFIPVSPSCLIAPTSPKDREVSRWMKWRAASLPWCTASLGNWVTQCSHSLGSQGQGDHCRNSRKHSDKVNQGPWLCTACSPQWNISLLESSGRQKPEPVQGHSYVSVSHLCCQATLRKSCLWWERQRG